MTIISYKRGDYIVITGGTYIGIPGIIDDYQLDPAGGPREYLITLLPINESQESRTPIPRSIYHDARLLLMRYEFYPCPSEIIIELKMKY